MQVSPKTIEGSVVRFSLEGDATELDAAMDAAFRDLQGRMKIKGFRPGKAPRQVVEANLGGAGALRGYAIEELFSKAYPKALNELDIEPVASPDVEVDRGRDGGVVHIKVSVEVRLPVTVEGYADMEVAVPSPIVSDSDIDEAIYRERERWAELAKVDRPASRGDVLTVDLVVRKADSGQHLHMDDFVYELGSGALAEAVAERLIGVSVGDEVEVVIPAARRAGNDPGGGERDGHDVNPDPDPLAEVEGGTVEGGSRGDAGDEGEAGLEETPAEYVKVVVKQVEEKILPEAGDEWARLATEFETIQELRDDLAERLRSAKRMIARSVLAEATARSLAELVAEEPPEALVADVMRERSRSIAADLEKHRIDIDRFIEERGEERFYGELRDASVREVRTDLALRALAAAEGIDVTEEELADELSSLSRRLGVTIETARERAETAGVLPELRAERRKAKALRWLMEHVSIVDENGVEVRREYLLEDEPAAQSEPAPSPGAEMAGVLSEADMTSPPSGAVAP